MTGSNERYSLRAGRPALPLRWSRGLLVALLGLLLIGCAPIEVRMVETPATVEPGGSGQELEGEAGAATVDPMTEQILSTVVAYLTVFAEACGALVIGVALLRAIAAYLRFIFGRSTRDEQQEDIRLRLGRALTVALEFELAADVLKTAIAPTWNIIAQLAAIVVLRTLLNYFLERELRQAEQRVVRAEPEEGARAA